MAHLRRQQGRYGPAGGGPDPCRAVGSRVPRMDSRLRALCDLSVAESPGVRGPARVRRASCRTCLPDGVRRGPGRPRRRRPTRTRTTSALVAAKEAEARVLLRRPGSCTGPTRCRTWPTSTSPATTGTTRRRPTGGRPAPAPGGLAGCGGRGDGRAGRGARAGRRGGPSAQPAAWPPASTRPSRERRAGRARPAGRAPGGGGPRRAPVRASSARTGSPGC